MRKKTITLICFVMTILGFSIAVLANDFTEAITIEPVSLQQEFISDTEISAAEIDRLKHRIDLLDLHTQKFQKAQKEIKERLDDLEKDDGK